MHGQNRNLFTPDPDGPTQVVDPRAVDRMERRQRRLESLARLQRERIERLEEEKRSLNTTVEFLQRHVDYVRKQQGVLS